MHPNGPGAPMMMMPGIPADTGPTKYVLVIEPAVNGWSVTVSEAERPMRQLSINDVGKTIENLNKRMQAGDVEKIIMDNDEKAEAESTIQVELGSHVFQEFKEMMAFVDLVYESQRTIMEEKKGLKQPKATKFNSHMQS